MTMTSTQKNERLDMIKNIAKKQKIASDEAKSFKATIQKLDERKKILKAHQKLTRQVKKAGTQAPSSLECNSPENMYYSDKDNARFLAGSSIMDSYNEMKSMDDWD